MHFLGTSKLEWAVMLTDIQRAIRKYHNPNFTISFDCASPFLASANGQIYIQTETPHQGKWTYRMAGSVDDKKYANDNRKFSDAVLQDRIFENFTDSPISNRIQINDVCYYAPGDLNKIGKEGRTSWDSFSYALQMGHNVWTHIYAVQEANRQYDAGLHPAMMAVHSSNKKSHMEYSDHNYFKDIVNAIFATSSRGQAEALVEHYEKYWRKIIGTRGATGDSTFTAMPIYNLLFEEEPATVEEHHIDDSGFDETALDKLEELGDE
jgi:hypothetical protein